MTANKYEFDSVRWLRNVAEVQSHRAGAGAAMLRENMLKCAVEIERLRAENDALRAHVARLEEALKELLDYTRACEGLLNASESGACVKGRRALEEK